MATPEKQIKQLFFILLHTTSNGIIIDDERHHRPIAASILCTSASINSNRFPTFSLASSKSTVIKIGPTSFIT